MKNKILALFVILILFSAISLELLFDIKPCILCTIQRLLWLIVLFFIIINKKTPIYLGLIGNIGVSLYQTTLQYDFFSSQKSSLCKIVDYSQVTCDIFDFHIGNWGFSLALVNLILCASMLIYILRNKK